MTGRSEVLREVMLETGTTQSELSRLSGVRQPSISQFLSGRVELSDDMLDRLLSCMGYRLEVVRRPVRRELNRSSERSWQLHRRLSTQLTPETFERWRPTMLRNLKRLRGSVQGQPHVRNLDRWQRLVRDRDVPGLRRVMTGLDTDSVEMREVSPMGGPLPQEVRSQVLRLAGSGRSGNDGLMRSPLTDDEINALLDDAEQYQSVIRVKAVQLDRPVDWTPRSGDELRASAGDWMLESGGESWTVAANVFADTYEAVGEGIYRKVTPVRAARLSREVTVRTIEGLASAKAGDWLVMNPGGDTWPVSAVEFERRYELVG